MDWSKFSKDAVSEIGALCVGELSKMKESIMSETRLFLDDSKNQIEEWTKKVVTGELAKDDYDVLLKGKASVVKMMLLKQKGIRKIEAEKMSASIIETLISMAFKLIP